MSFWMTSFLVWDSWLKAAHPSLCEVGHGPVLQRAMPQVVHNVNEWDQSFGDARLRLLDVGVHNLRTLPHAIPYDVIYFRDSKVGDVLGMGILVCGGQQRFVVAPPAQAGAKDADEGIINFSSYLVPCVEKRFHLLYGFGEIFICSFMFFPSFVACFLCF